jgi:hypothetical protein
MAEWSTEGCKFSIAPPWGTTLQPINPYVILQVSRDGGNTWGNEMWREIGKVGEYRKQIKWNRLGKSTDAVFKIVISDPIKVVLCSAVIDADLGNGRR